MIHLNGTSSDALVDQRIEVLNALNDLHKAIRAAWPNGRDYYPCGDGALRAAEEVWQERLDVVADMKAQVESEIEAILDE